jgi:ABC-type oligopeptide transport system ATPase subunit
LFGTRPGHPSELVAVDEPIAMADVCKCALLLDLMMELKQEFDLTTCYYPRSGDCHMCAIVLPSCTKLWKLALHEVYENSGHPYTRALLMFRAIHGTAMML